MSSATPSVSVAEETRTAISPPPQLASRLSWREGAGYFALAVLLDLVVGLPVLQKVASGALINPDSYMRLVRLREMLARHAPIDVVARDGSGAGTVLHWSHLLDSIILVLAAPLGLVMAAPDAVHWAAVALGPLSIGCLGLALAWALAPLSAREWRWTAPVLAALSPLVVGYGIAGVVHHHVLVALAVVMTMGWAGRAAFIASKAGWQMGAWAGAGLWLSPETMPFTLLAYGALGLGWLLQPTRAACGEALRNSGCAVLLVTAAAFAADPPAAGYESAELLHISVVHLLLAAALCVIGLSAWQLDRRRLTRVRRGVVGAAIAFAVIGLWLAAFPMVLRGPEGVIDARDAAAYFGVIAEMQPIATLRDAVADLLDGALATAVAASVALRVRSFWWAYAAFCGVLLLVLGASHARFAIYPAIFAAAMLPAVLTWCGRAFEQVQALAPSAVLGVILLVHAANNIAGPHSSTSAAQASSCTLANIGPLLAPYDGRVVMAEVSDTPELLYRSKVLTVGSLYANIPAFMRLRAAWRSVPGNDVPASVAATRASLVLFCPRAERSNLVADLPPDTVLDRLNRIDPPRWLTKIGEDSGSGYVLYRIIPGGGAG